MNEPFLFCTQCFWAFYEYYHTHTSYAFYNPFYIIKQFFKTYYIQFQFINSKNVATDVTAYTEQHFIILRIEETIYQYDKISNIKDIS